MHVRGWAALQWCVGLLLPATVTAQTSLTEALTRADSVAFPNRAATAESHGAQARRTIPMKGIVPSLRIETGLARTTDPIGTFGATLRQRTITTADFDPARLNFPDAVTNYQGGLVVEQPLFNADAWIGRRAASQGVNAAAANLGWTRMTTRRDVVTAWFAVRLASEQSVALQDAVHSARAHARLSELMAEQGLVTRSDALLASVKAGELEAQLADARSRIDLATGELTLVTGYVDRAHAPTLSAAMPLPSSDRIRALALPETLTVIDSSAASARYDVDGARLGTLAASSDVQRARSLRLPRVNSFARYDWNSARQPYGGQKSWTFGVLATWSVLGGGANAAEVQEAEAHAEGARVSHDRVLAQARLDMERTRLALVVALLRLDIAVRSVAQSGEAHRIVARKYEGGLATVTELLDAASTATASSLALAQARFAVIVTTADRLRALGRDPGTLAILDDRTVAQTTMATPLPSTVRTP